MPVLESPEVIVTEHISGLTKYHQDVIDHVSGLDGDIVEETDLLGHLGLNPFFSSAHLYQSPGSSYGNPIISLRIQLSEAWNNMASVLADAAEHGIPVKEEINPLNQYSEHQSSTLVVSGAQNILAFGERLRTSFEVSARDDGAVYYRPVLHPALLGIIMDDVEAAVEKSKLTDPNSFHHAAYSKYDWRL